MKKYVAMLLVIAMAFSLCACGAKIDEETQEKLDLYDKYEDYIEMLEDEDYEKLITELVDLYNEQQNNKDPENPDDPDDPDGPETPDVPVVEEPTDEEYDQLWEYARLVDKLNDYAEGNNIYYDVYDEDGNYVNQANGSEALGLILERLKLLVVVDKWADTDYVSGIEYGGEPTNWDRMGLIGKFTMVENVLLKQFSTTTDHMGNVNTDSWGPRWYYNANGTLNYVTDPDEIVEMVETNPMGFYNTPFHFYGDDGRVSEIKYGYYDGDTLKVSTLATNTYDAAGNLTAQHIKTNDGECDITYTYDANGRLTQIDCPTYVNSDYRYTYTYSYDADGHLVKEEKVEHYYSDYYDTDMVNHKEITEYTYDANGVLTGGSYTHQWWRYESESDYNSNTGEWTYTVEQYVYQQWQDQHTYTCDSNGSILTKTVTYGDTIYMYGDNAGQVCDTPSYESEVIELVYGDYYFYGEE